MRHTDKLFIEALATTYGTTLLTPENVRDPDFVDKVGFSGLWHAAQGNSFSTQAPNGESYTFINSKNSFYPAYEANKDELDYWIGLHEIGHIALRHVELDKRKLTPRQIADEEGRAWQWARDHANRPPTEAAEAYIRWALDTYEQECDPASRLTFCYNPEHYVTAQAGARKVQQPPVCPNCGQWQSNDRVHPESRLLYRDCLNECATRGFAPKLG